MSVYQSVKYGGEKYLSSLPLPTPCLCHAGLFIFLFVLPLPVDYELPAVVSLIFLSTAVCTGLKHTWHMQWILRDKQMDAWPSPNKATGHTALTLWNSWATNLDIQVKSLLILLNLSELLG